MPKVKEIVPGYSFVEEGHKHLFDGKRMTGVTTVLGVIAKPALIGWAAGQATEYVAQNWKPDTSYRKEVIEQVLADAKKAHTIKRDKAADIGTAVHKAIEEYIKNSKEPELDEQGMKMFNNFKDWVKNNNIKFIDSEKHIYSKEKFIAGICDSVVEIDGKKWLVDYKTGGTRVYGSAMWQMAGYEILLNEMGEHKDITGYIVLGIFKDGTTEEKRSISKEDHQKAFLACLDIYRLQQKTEDQIL